MMDRGIFRMNPLALDELDPIDRASMRRAYKCLRIVMYAPQSSPYAKDGMYQGCYGMSRDEAKQLIQKFWEQVSWAIYIGSK